MLQPKRTASFNANPDINLDFLTQEYNRLSNMIASGQNIPTEQLVQMALAYPTKVTLVEDEAAPSDSGQYGIKLGYYAPELGETEFGLYYMNYHSRRPLISGTTADFSTGALLSDMAVLGQNAGNINREVLLSLDSFSKAQVFILKISSSMALASTPCLAIPL